MSNYGFVVIGDIVSANSTCLIREAPQTVKGKVDSGVSKGATNAIIDLYDKTGTLLSPACSVTAVFTPEGALVTGKWATAVWTHDCWLANSTEC